MEAFIIFGAAFLAAWILRGRANRVLCLPAAKTTNVCRRCGVLLRGKTICDECDFVENNSCPECGAFDYGCDQNWHEPHCSGFKHPEKPEDKDKCSRCRHKRGDHGMWWPGSWEPNCAIDDCDCHRFEERAA